MKKMTFDAAYSNLEKIIHQIEGDTVPLDELAAKVKEAKGLLKFCEEKLRGIEKELAPEKAEE